MHSSKLTPERHEELFNLLSLGMPIKHACGMVGITPATYYNWLRRAEEEDAHEAYVAFAYDMGRAEGLAIAEAIKVCVKAIKAGDHQMTRWWLACKCPEEFGKRAQVKAEVKVNGHIGVRLEAEQLDTADRESLNEHLAALFAAGAASND